MTIVYGPTLLQGSIPEGTGGEGVDSFMGVIALEAVADVLSTVDFISNTLGVLLTDTDLLSTIDLFAHSVGLA